VVGLEGHRTSNLAKEARLRRTVSRDRNLVPVSVAGGPPVRVPYRQLEAAGEQIAHLERLSGRLLAAAATGTPLELSESEAILLAAEIRFGAANGSRPLEELAEALRYRRPR
jgi:hypothetical protein